MIILDERYIHAACYIWKFLNYNVSMNLSNIAALTLSDHSPTTTQGSIIVFLAFYLIELESKSLLEYFLFNVYFSILISKLF